MLLHYKIFFLIFFLLPIILFPNSLAFGQSNITTLPVLKEDSFVIEEYISGLNFPTNFDFIENDIIILEKNGNVRLVENHILLDDPIKTFEVGSSLEEGLLGVVVKDDYVYLHYTTNDDDSGLTSNWFYKYSWVERNLVEPILLFEIHDGNFGHNSGVMTVFENQVIMVIGDLFNRQGITQNNHLGNLDFSSVIMPIDPPGEPIAIGIRNSFGLDVDPITGNLWDTENGDDSYDEVNLVFPNFNSGWNITQGPATDIEKEKLKQNINFEYRDPVFSWERPIGITSIHFISSSNFENFSDLVLVGAFHNGNLYGFKLNSDRNGFIFENEQLFDNVLDTSDDSSEIVFGTGFRGIVDIKEGPDGNIYLLSIGDGKLFKLSYDQNKNPTIQCNHNQLKNSQFRHCDFSNLDFSNLDLSNKDFAFSQFNNSNLTGTIFTNSTLVNSNFMNSKLKATNFKNTNLESSIFTNNELKNIDFTNSNMKSTLLKNSNIDNSNFKNTNLEFSLISNSKISNSDFSNSNMYYSDLSNSTLFKLNFTNSDLTFAKLNNINAKFLDFTSSRLWKTQLKNSDLDNSIFINSDNYYSTYENSSLIKSNFANSRFSDINFENSNLSESNLLNIYPMNSNFKDTILDNSEINTCLNSDPLSKIINRVFRATIINTSEPIKFLTNFLLTICN